MKYSLNVYLSFGALSLMLLAVVYAYFLIFYPIETIEVHNPMRVLTKNVIAGQDLIYQSDYCKYDNAPAKVSRTLVGPDFIPLPIVNSVTAKGCRKVVIHLPIPASTYPGVYHMDAKVEIQVNPLRIEVKDFSTEDFTVSSPSAILKE